MTLPSENPEPSPLLMPPPDGEAPQPVVVPPPPSFGRQMAQLIIIPAVIVGVAVGIALLFGKIAGQADSLDNQLLKLRQSSGAGKLGFGGLQDPAYKDRSLAAYNVAQMIRTIKDPQAKLKTSKTLVDILEHNVGPEEDMLQVYLLIAIGQLGQEGGLDVITQRLDNSRAAVREGAVSGILAWQDVDQAKKTVPALTAKLSDESARVREKAAAALGELATKDDQAVITGLRQAMNSDGLEMREAVWNAATALARLGDPQGSRYVAAILLDRATLAKLPAEDTGTQTRVSMSPDIQDRVILSTLAAARTMTDPVVWDKIKVLADNDPNRAVKSAARQLIAAHGKMD